MSFDEIFGLIIMALITVSFIIVTILVPLNFKAKDKLQHDLLQECLKLPNAIECVDHLNNYYNAQDYRK